jgi:AraC-like DNA-binding protein
MHFGQDTISTFFIKIARFLSHRVKACSPMSDRLSTLLQRFEPRARLTHAGLLLRSNSSPPACISDHAEHEGLLLLLRRGAVQITPGRDAMQRCQLTQAGLIYLPCPGQAVELLPMHEAGAQVLAARMSWGHPDHNPLLGELPQTLQHEQSDLGTLEPTWHMLWTELMERSCAHRNTLQRLMEVMMIQLVRRWLDTRTSARHSPAPAGVGAGLADSRLLRVLDAMHSRPEQAWTLEALAALADMSRARFAAHFHATIGQPPASYLTSWRMGLAQELLLQRSVKDVAQAVGYASPTAFCRAFTQHTGQAPRAWAKLTAGT